MIKHKSNYYVYIVTTSNGAYYTGYTNNLENRLKLHDSGHGAKYLRGRTPLSIVYVKEYKYLKNAMHAERNIKKYTVKRKEELIKSWTVANLNAGTPTFRFLKRHDF